MALDRRALRAARRRSRRPTFSVRDRPRATDGARSPRSTRRATAISTSDVDAPTTRDWPRRTRRRDARADARRLRGRPRRALPRPRARSSSARRSTTARSRDGRTRARPSTRVRARSRTRWIRRATRWTAFDDIRSGRARSMRTRTATGTREYARGGEDGRAGAREGARRGDEAGWDGRERDEATLDGDPRSRERARRDATGSTTASDGGGWGRSGRRDA